MLELKDNFKKIKNIKSNLLYGEMIDDAEFTLVIPVYGMNKYLPDLFENIIDQEKCDLRVQIIISDNKEYKDDTNPVIECLKKYEHKFQYKVAYFLAEKTLNQYNNFNRCVELSKTEYIGMIHDDDLLVKNYFKTVEKTLVKIKNNSKIAMVHAAFLPFEDTIKVENVLHNRIYKITSLEMAHIGQTGAGVPSCGTIFVRSKFIKSGGFNDNYPSSGDAIIAGVMVKLGFEVCQFYRYIGYYRIGVNTSLKLEVCQGFIKEDYFFMSEWCQSGLLEKLEWKLYENLVYSLNIDGKIDMFSKYNKEITVENLDFRKKYKKYNVFSPIKFLYRVGWKFIAIRHRIKAINI